MLVADKHFAALPLQVDFGASGVEKHAQKFPVYDKTVGRAFDGGNHFVVLTVFIEFTIFVVAVRVLPFMGTAPLRRGGGQLFYAVQVFPAHGSVGGIEAAALVGALPVFRNAFVGGFALLAGKPCGMAQRGGKGKQDKVFFHGVSFHLIGFLDWEMEFYQCVENNSAAYNTG